MTIKQLSILVENKNGALLQVLQLLRDNGISIIVSTLGDTLDFGIYRIICSDTQRAYTLLRDKNINAKISDVFAIRLAEDKAGAVADMLAKITEAGVGIKYMYSFLFGGKGIIVFRADKDEDAEKAIMLNKLDFLSEDELKYK